jgi:hypothetical protein
MALLVSVWLGGAGFRDNVGALENSDLLEGEWADRQSVISRALVLLKARAACGLSFFAEVPPG